MSTIKLGKQSQAMLTRFSEGMCTLNDVCSTLEADKISIENIGTKGGGLTFIINQETEEIDELTGWPVLVRSEIPAYKDWSIKPVG